MLRSGDQIGSYTLKRQLGRGAFGVVWLAEKVTPIATTEFALKFALDETPDLEAVKAEAKLWKEACGHPNVLPIIEADIYEGFVVIVSAYAPDGSLDAYLKDDQAKALPLASALEMVSGILAGLEHLHSRRIIHRDLKPPNILLQGSTPLLADFGIARLLSTNVHTTTVAGTPYYMAPEAFNGVRSVKTDIWSVGVILYQLLTRRLPFVGNDIATLMEAVRHEHPAALPSSIPKAVQEAVGRALDKNPATRYQSAAEMRQALQAALFSLSHEDTIKPLPEPVPPSPPDPDAVQPTAPPGANSANWRRRLIPGLLALLLLVGGITLATRFSFISGKLGFGNRSYPLETADPQKLEIRKTLIGHTEAVNSLAFTPDSTLLVSGSADGVIFWDAQTGEIKRKLSGTEKGVRAIALSPDGKILATADEGNTIEVRTVLGGRTVRLWEVATGTLKHTLTGLQWGVKAIAVAPGGDLVVGVDVTETMTPYNVASGSDMKVWNVQTGELKRTMTKHDELVNSIAFSPDGKILLSSDKDKIIRGWDVQTGALLWEVEASSAIGVVAFAPDGKSFAGVAQEGSINIWDATTHDLKSTL